MREAIELRLLRMDVCMDVCMTILCARINSTQTGTVTKATHIAAPTPASPAVKTYIIYVPHECDEQQNYRHVTTRVLLD